MSSHSIEPIVRKRLMTRASLAGLAAMLLVACSSSPQAVRKADELSAAGQSEQALQMLREAMQSQPRDAQVRSAYLHLRDRQINDGLVAGYAALRSQPEAAEAAFKRVLATDPTNAQAAAGLNTLKREAASAQTLSDAEQAIQRRDDAGAMSMIRQVLLQDPSNEAARRMLRTVQSRQPAATAEQQRTEALQKPVTLDFKDATLKQVFDVLAKTSGLNFVFDKDVKTDQRVSVVLKNKSTRDAVDVILLTSQLEQRAVDASTILIYPSTPAKLKDYQSLTMRSFFLANADIETVAASIKTLVKTRDLIVDKKQNLLIMRDTPEAVRIAENLVALHDLPEPEVMLEVEILEVNRNRLSELGIKYPDQLTLTPLPSAAGGSLTVQNLRQANTSTVGVTVTPLTINARALDTDVKLLANPRIRAKNRETAKILIGDKVPNITSTSTSTGFVSENVQYLDVGLKLDITPTISIDNDVTIKIALEVSNIANQVKTSSGTLAYQIGTRTASTVLRLRDGENQVLAGLINDDDRRTSSKVPGFGSLPLLGRLFSSDLDQRNRNEIVLSITPRLVRNLTRPEAALLEFDSGTESAARSGGGTSSASSVASGTPPVASGGPSTAAPPGSPPMPGNPYAAGANLAANNAFGSGTGAPANTTAPGIRWQGPLQVKAGDSFSVQLVVSPPQPIYGLSYVLGLDPAVFEVQGLSEGGFLKQGGSETTFSPRIDRSTGQIFVTNLRGGAAAAGAATASSLITLNLKALAAGGPSQIQVLTINAQGKEGASVSLPLPAPLAVTVNP